MSTSSTVAVAPTRPPIITHTARCGNRPPDGVQRESNVTEVTVPSSAHDVAADAARRFA